MILSRKCRIEPLKHEHYDDIYSLYSNKSVRTYLGGVPEKNDIDASFNRMLASPFPNTFFYITLKEMKEFIGLVSIDEYHEEEMYELSYQFLPQYWGKGYAFEVLSAVRDYGIYRLKLTHLVAETQTANIASCRVLEKLGMQKVKELERFGQTQAVYELRREEESAR